MKTYTRFYPELELNSLNIYRRERRWKGPRKVSPESSWIVDCFSFWDLVFSFPNNLSPLFEYTLHYAQKICFPVLNFMTQSLPQNILRRVVRWLMKNEFERIWKEVIMAWSSICHEELRKTTKTSVRIAVVFEPMTSVIQIFIITATSNVSVRKCVRIHHNQYVTQFPKEAARRKLPLIFLEYPSCSSNSLPLPIPSV
jgi:hypothetical protein